jgi:hypothetical protein
VSGGEGAREGAARSEGRMSTLSLRVLDALSDGEWHDYEEVIEAAQYSIAPGEAYRWGKERSQAAVDTRSMDDIIASGRRSQTVGIINNLVGNKRIERNINGRSNEGKKLRLLQPAPQVYVIRDDDDRIQVYTWMQGVSTLVNIHILDLKAQTSNPKQEAESVKKIFDSLPSRMAGKDEIMSACRALMNRHNIAAAMKSLMEEGFDEFPQPPPPRTSDDSTPEPNNSQGDTSPAPTTRWGMTYE